MSPTSEFARLWNSGLPGVELFSAHLVRHRFGKHMHEEYTIGLNDAGQGCFSCRGDTWRSPPGSLNLINPGEPHTGQADSAVGWRFRNFYISTPQMAHLLTQLEWGGRGLPFFAQPVVLDQGLKSALDRLFSACIHPVSALAHQSLWLEVMAQLVVKHSASHAPAPAGYRPTRHNPETNAVALTRAYLEAHYAEPVSIDALAQRVGLSPYYLIRCFRRQVGVPPHGYQRHWQLVQAKRSLHSARPLAEIAAEHGFYDQSHFNRSFKRAFGITPGHYQKGNLIQYAQAEGL